VAAILAATHRAPTWGFYLAALGIIVLLVAAAVVLLTDVGEPPAVRQGSVLRALEHEAASAESEERR
jgi:hypothetical protein